MNVILQGVFMDEFSPRGDAAGELAALGALGPVLRPSATAPFAPSSPATAADRRDLLRQLKGAPLDEASSAWHAYRTSSAYGAGRAYEDGALRRMAAAVESSLGSPTAAKLLGEAADAQLSTGHRARASRFTRLELSALHLDQLSLAERVDALLRGIERVQTGYQYYVSGSGGKTDRSGKWPVDETYSEELADQLIEAACNGRATLEAGADLLPLARRLARNPWRAVPAKLFDAIGMDRLGSGDLVPYSGCTDDAPTRAKALSLAWEADGVDPVLGRNGLRMSLMQACVEVSDYDRAEALVNALLQDAAVGGQMKANTASFHWYDGGQNTVGLNADVGGAAMGAEQQTWTVQEPANVSLVLTPGPPANIRIPPGSGQLWYGYLYPPDTPAMLFSFQGSCPQEFGGEFRFVQTIERHSTATKYDGSSGSLNVGPWLDNVIPYGSVTRQGGPGQYCSATMGDTPAMGVAPYRHVTDDIDFHTWLIFRPEGGTWVPLRRATWAAGAEFTDVPPVRKDRGTLSSTASGPTLQHPIWPDTYVNGEVMNYWVW